MLQGKRTDSKERNKNMSESFKLSIIYNQFIIAQNTF